MLSLHDTWAESCREFQEILDRVKGPGNEVSLSLRLKDLFGPVTRVKKKREEGTRCDFICKHM